MAYVYRYTFDKSLRWRAICDSLSVAVFATEGLCGSSQVRLDSAFAQSRARRLCVIDGSTRVGRVIARIFTGLLQREFGERAFQLERLPRAVANRDWQLAGANPKPTLKPIKEKSNADHCVR